VELSGAIHALAPYSGWARRLVWKFGEENNLLHLPQIEGNYHLSNPWPIHYTDCTIPAHNFADDTEKNHLNFNRLAGVPPEI
jgi:hypothetical protein